MERVDRGLVCEERVKRTAEEESVSLRREGVFVNFNLRGDAADGDLIDQPCRGLHVDGTDRFDAEAVRVSGLLIGFLKEIVEAQLSPEDIGVGEATLVGGQM